MEIDLKLCNFAAEKVSLLGACPQQGVGMKVKNKPWHSLNYTPKSLEEIVLPKSISFIGGNVFKDCRNLKKINLSVCDKLEKIEYGSFSGCESLEEIKIPKNITSIGAKAFGGCVNLVNVDFREFNKQVQNYEMFL